MTSALEGVRDWLNEEGFPFEMRVTKTFISRGFGAVQGEYYIDPDSGKPREMDVIASLAPLSGSEDFSILLQFIVECKVIRDKQWVLFTGANSFQQPVIAIPSEYQQPGGILCSNLLSIETLPSPGFFKGPSRTAYSITTAHQNNDDRAYKAISNVRRASRNAKFHSGPFSAILKKHNIQIMVPLAVIDGLLFRAFLDGTGELVVENIQSGRLSLKYGDPNEEAVIDIVKYDYLNTYLDQVKTETKIVFDECEKEPMLYQNRFYGALKNIVNRT